MIDYISKKLNDKSGFGAPSETVFRLCKDKEICTKGK